MIKLLSPTYGQRYKVIIRADYQGSYENAKPRSSIFWYMTLDNGVGKGTRQIHPMRQIHPYHKEFYHG